MDGDLAQATCQGITPYQPFVQTRPLKLLHACSLWLHVLCNCASCLLSILSVFVVSLQPQLCCLSHAHLASPQISVLLRKMPAVINLHTAQQQQSI